MVVAVTRRSSEDVTISPFLCKDPQILGGDKQHCSEIWTIIHSAIYALKEKIRNRLHASEVARLQSEAQ